jgi:glycosyltransferase involved in cell wall biosynthesis
MNILFIHQNFPAQFTHLARSLGETGHRVVAITRRLERRMEGVALVSYEPDAPASDTHPYLGELDRAVRNGLAVAQACRGLARDGFVPHLVVGHSGWGEILYVKDVWPRVPLLGYFEFFYRPTGSDMDFDPEFPPEADAAERLRTRNALNLMTLDAADWGLTPTRWQRDGYTARERDRISVIHEGIDTAVVRPDSRAQIWLGNGRCLQAGDEVLTFSARNLEPYRGFHRFMRALPEILRRRPEAQCLILGGDGVSYGRAAPDGGPWRARMLAELDGRIDLGRVHFLGALPYAQYLAVLQLSRVHVYLTYPFVLSWSLLEALAAGCLVVGSRSGPVEEVMTDHENGWLVDFFDAEALVERVVAGLSGQGDIARLQRNARLTVQSRYDLRTICLPAQMKLLQNLIVRCA